MDTLLIIQARMGSSRLPGKVLKMLGGHTTLEYVIRRCFKIPSVNKIVVATSNLKQDNLIEFFCDNQGVECFRGDEKNVLSRYVSIADKYKPQFIVRVTADCPFLDFQMAEEMIRLIKKSKVDIIDYNEGFIPRGIGVEVLTYTALQYIYENSNKDYQKEHVTYYAYEEEHKDEFSRYSYKIPEKLHYPQHRLTLDTVEDYELLNKLANYFKDIEVSTGEIIAYLNRNSDISSINDYIKQKNIF